MGFDLIDLSEKKTAIAPTVPVFPGLIDRFRNVWGRFQRKSGIFLRLSALSLAALAASVPVLSLILKERDPGMPAIAAAAAVILVVLLLLLGLQASMLAAAAFKIDLRKSLTVGFANLFGWLST